MPASIPSNNKEFQIVGRHLPTDADPNPKVYRMRIFAPNYVIAKSRFWYYLKKLKKIKKANGELLSCNQVKERSVRRVKNYGVYVRYVSRSNIHNMHKEYRDVSRCGAIDQMYNEMAGQHRARRNVIQIIEASELAGKDVRRAQTKQFLDSKIKFPLPHRVQRVAMKRHRRRFLPKRPNTFW